jgi:hypothetical protein
VEALKVVCAWCKETIREGDLPVSHGICLSCYAAVIEEKPPLSPASMLPGMSGRPVLA